MVDKNKIKKLAKIMTEYSMAVKKGEKVLKKGDKKKAIRIYIIVKKIYSTLDDNKKKEVYSLILDYHKKITRFKYIS